MFSEVIYTTIIITSAILIVFLTCRYKLNPFFILIPSSFILCMISEVSPSNTLTAIRNGFGATAGYYGILIIAGTAISVILEKTGALITITDAVTGFTGRKKAPAFITAAGSILSVSCPSESGFILFAPAGKLIEKENGKPAGSVTVALAAGICTLHSILPLSAGPLAAAGMLNSGMLKFFFAAVICSFSGTAAAYFWCRYFISTDPDLLHRLADKKHIMTKELPAPGISVLPLAVPLFLISLKSFTSSASRPLGNGIIFSFFEFTGEPSVAILIGLSLALLLLRKNDFGNTFSSWVSESIDRSAKLLVLAMAGGAFGAALKATPLVKTLSGNFVFAGAGLLLPFLISAAVKTVNGSSTIAMITAASLSSSFITTAGLDPSYAAVAITAGSLMVSHANDPYFWIVSHYSGISTKETYKYFTTATLISGLASFTVVWLISLLF